MERITCILLTLMLCSACSKDDLKEVVVLPDAVSNQSSSVSLPDSMSSAASSSNLSLGMSSSALSMASSMAAYSSESAQSSAESAQSSAESTLSSMAAYSSSSQAAGASEDPAQLFGQLCASCHNLQDNEPFQIGGNLSFSELSDTISNTMPFNNSHSCTAECATVLAYFIEESRRP